MRILHITDLHGEIKYIDQISDAIASSHLVAVTGDIVKNGEGRAIGDIMERIGRLNRNIIAVHGNWDGEDVQEFLSSRGYSLHREGRIIDGIGFFGVGGSGATPFRSPSEYSEEELLAFIREGHEKIRSAGRKVLISHTPPKNTTDRTFLGIRVGSPGVREFIEKNSIDLCLTGHIHEASGTDVLNGCIIANPGSFKKGKYLEADIDEKNGTSLDDVRLMKAGRI